jgi:hypothetical protein
LGGRYSFYFGSTGCQSGEGFLHAIDRSEKSTHEKARVGVFGQAGIIQQTSDKVGLVTNLHNLISENPSDGGDSVLAKRVRLRLANDYDFDAFFEELGTYLDTLRAITLREGESAIVSWKFGIDIGFGTFDISPGETAFEDEGLHAFECVEPDFEYVSHNIVAE